jgi:hypothetical protein
MAREGAVVVLSPPVVALWLVPFGAFVPPPAPSIALSQADVAESITSVMPTNAWLGF